jgi:hypothetical protein
MDYSTPAGQVRLLIADVSDDPGEQYLSSEQIAGYLTLNAGSVRRAAADALDAIASSEALVSKVIRSQDLQTDGAKLADALRAHADRLRVQAEDTDFAFDIVFPVETCVPELTEYPQPWVWY